MQCGFKEYRVKNRILDMCLIECSIVYVSFHNEICVPPVSVPHPIKNTFLEYVVLRKYI